MELHQKLLMKEGRTFGKKKSYYNNKSSKEIIGKDAFWENVLNSRLLYWIIFLFVMIYLCQDDRILNIPTIFLGYRCVAAMLVIVGFFFYRFRKFKVYYVRKLKDKVYLVFFLLGFMISSLVLQGILSIPLNMLIKESSKRNQIEIYDCKITNVLTTNIDKIHFEFLGKRYSRYFDVNGYKREDLINNYYLIVRARRTFNDIFYVESLSLKMK